MFRLLSRYVIADKWRHTVSMNNLIDYDDTNAECIIATHLAKLNDVILSL